MELRGTNALLTGAAGGLGRAMADALAAAGANVVLSGRNEAALADLRNELTTRHRTKLEVVTGDLADTSQVPDLVERSESAIGPLDVLVNNAGIELTAAFDTLEDEQLEGIVTLNLTSPMLLTRAVLPGMLERRRGHVVNVASLAGKAGPPYDAPYAATKAGLIGLTQSLRAELAGEPVGVSVVCPGFVGGDGMYQRAADQGIKAPVTLGETTREKVAQAVVNCITRDIPEALVTPRPVRPLLAFAALAPRTSERLVRVFGANDFFRRVADTEERA